jgi:hypothetical protein
MESMLKAAPINAADEADTALAKRPRTQEYVKLNAKYAYYVQQFHHDKKWSLTTHPWEVIDGLHFTLTLSEHHGMGVHIVAGDGESITVFPFGPDGVKCLDRAGCGGVVQRGKSLQWRVNCLLQYECGPVRADVMVVHLNTDHMRTLENIDIEQAVRAIFHVHGEMETTEPCWRAGSVAENHRDYYKHHAQEYSADLFKLQLGYHKMQRELVSQKEALDKQLQLYKKMKDSITQCATCSVCTELAPEDDPCMLAPCGHFLCNGCYRDYFKAIGNSRPRCGQCLKTAPEQSWHVMWFLTGVATAIKKTEQIEVND